MNLRLCISLLILSGGLLDSCQDHGKSGTDLASGMLQKPPFAAITDSIAQFPKDAQLYLHRAALLSQTNNHQIAMVDYEKAWSLAPDERTGILYAANLSILGMNKERLSVLEECVRKFPGNPGFVRLMGETYVELGNSKEALELYQTMLQKDSTDFETWYEKGLLMEKMMDTPSAVDALRKAYALKPLHTYGLELAHLYAESSNAECLQICDEILAQDPLHELVDPFFIKGIYYSNGGKYNQAIIQYDSCIRRDWKYTDAYIEKGIAFFKQKNYDEALNTFRMASTVSNTDPDAYFWMGRCYETLKKTDEAIVQYERALGLEKNFKEAREALQRLQP